MVATSVATLLIRDEGYKINKQEFWDLVNIRYGWPLSRSTRTRARGNNFNIEILLHARKEVFVK